MKVKNIFGLAALAIAMAACSSENDLATNEGLSSKGKTVTLTATLSPKSASTRASLTDNGDGTLKAAWELGDEFHVVYNNGKSTTVGKIVSIDANGTATLSAELTDPEENSWVDVMYPKDFNTALQYFQQDGTLETISKKLFGMIATADLIVDGDKASIPGNLHLGNTNSILKLSLSDGTNDITKDVTSIDVLFQFERDGNSYSQTYTISNIASLSTIYMIMTPERESTKYKVTLYAQTPNGAYSMTKDNVMIERATMYTTAQLVLAPAAPAVSYLEWNRRGGFNTREAKIYTELHGEIVGGEMPGGWYFLTGQSKVVSTAGSQEADGKLKFTGDANIIIGEGSQLLLSQIDASGHSLNFYIQSDNGIGIYPMCKDGIPIIARDLRVHGGRICAYGASESATIAIQADQIEVYGGELEAVTENSHGIGFNNSFEINGGSVRGCIIGGTEQSIFTMHGGEVYASDPKGVKGVTGVNCHEIVVNGGRLEAIGGGGDETTPAGTGIISSTLTVDHGGYVFAKGGNNGENSGLAISSSTPINLGDGFLFFQSEDGNFTESSNPPCTMRFAEIRRQ